MPKISIKDLDRVELLRNLWEGQVKASFFTFNLVAAPVFDKEEA